MNSVFKMMNSVFKMTNFAFISPITEYCVEHYEAPQTDPLPGDRLYIN